MTAPLPFFLTTQLGSRLCIYHAPHRAAVPAKAETDCILHVHAFAEEMNNCRRTAASTARSLASLGYAVLQIDLYGCGDSSGDFVDARWEIWLDDLQTALNWIRQRHNGALHLWGDRLGALLATRFIVNRPGQLFDRVMLCQPILEGRASLNQLNRMLLARKMFSQSEQSSAAQPDRSTTDAAGLEFSGYTISADLILALNGQTAHDWKLAVRRIAWLELKSAIPLSTDRQLIYNNWLQSGNPVQLHLVDGLAYWQAPESGLSVAWVDACTDIFKDKNDGTN